MAQALDLPEDWGVIHVDVGERETTGEVTSGNYRTFEPCGTVTVSSVDGRRRYFDLDEYRRLVGPLLAEVQ